MPAVSVIIPVYNTEKYLRRCLDSVSRQTLRDIEIICINDGSTDGSATILAEYTARDARIKVITLERNRGAGVARNVGVASASGEYVGFVDSDDFVEPDFYARLHDAAKASGAEVAKGNIKVYDNVTHESRFERWLDINDRVKQDKAAFCFTFTTAVYSRPFLLDHQVRFLEGRIHFEDPYFTICVALYCDQVNVVDAAMYYYCVNPDSTSHNPTERHVRDFCLGFNDILSLLERSSVPVRHYIVVFDFIMGQLSAWCSSMLVPDSANRIAIRTYADALKRCRCVTQWLEYRFLSARHENRAFVIRQLRRKLKCK